MRVSAELDGMIRSRSSLSDELRHHLSYEGEPRTPVGAFEAGALAKGLKWLGWCPSVSTSFRRISGDRSRHSKRAPWTRRACVPCARRECGA